MPSVIDLQSEDGPGSDSLPIRIYDNVFRCEVSRGINQSVGNKKRMPKEDHVSPWRHDKAPFGTWHAQLELR